MVELTLAHEQQLLLRAQAQRLDPVVRLGAAGLSEAVFHEIDRALRSHGLIKVRAPGAQRADREGLSRAMAQRLGAARVQLIGNTIVLFRPIPDPGPQSSAPGARKAGAAVRGPRHEVARLARKAPPKSSKPRRSLARSARQR